MQVPTTLPQQKPRSVPLIVLMAFDKGEDGELLPAFDAREMPDERRAIQKAKEIASLHDGVITWSRDARPDIGEFGEPTVLFRRGSLPPDMDMPEHEEEELTLTWSTVTFPTPKKFGGFASAFSALYRKDKRRDQLALYGDADWPSPMTAYLPPAAAELAMRDLPDYAYEAGAAPKAGAVSLHVGNTLASDPAWFGLSLQQQRREREAVKLDPETAAAEDAYLIAMYARTDG